MFASRHTSRPDERLRPLQTPTESHQTKIEDSYPLSPMQQGMLFHSLLAPDSGVDIEQLYCELHETLDVAAFRRAWQRVVERHPILRTSFSWLSVDEPLQEVCSDVELPWTEHDWRRVALDERE